MRAVFARQAPHGALERLEFRNEPLVEIGHEGSGLGHPEELPLGKCAHRVGGAQWQGVLRLDEVAQLPRRNLRVLVRAEHILQLLQCPDCALRLDPVGGGEELEGVAQALPAQPQRVVLGRRRLRRERVGEGAEAAVAALDQLRRFDGGRWAAFGRAFGKHRGEVTQEEREGARVEARQHSLAHLTAALLEQLDERRQRLAFLLEFEVADLHVEVAHASEEARHPAELDTEIFRLRREPRPEERECRAQAPRGNAHIVQFLGIRAEARAGLVAHELGELLPQNRVRRLANGHRELDVRPPEVGRAGRRQSGQPQSDLVLRGFGGSQPASRPQRSDKRDNVLRARPRRELDLDARQVVLSVIRHIAGVGGLVERDFRRDDAVDAEFEGAPAGADGEEACDGARAADDANALGDGASAVQQGSESRLGEWFGDLLAVHGGVGVATSGQRLQRRLRSGPLRTDAQRVPRTPQAPVVRICVGVLEEGFGARANAVHAAVGADAQPALDSAEVGALELPFDLARLGGRVHAASVTGRAFCLERPFTNSYAVRTLTAHCVSHAVWTPIRARFVLGTGRRVRFVISWRWLLPAFLIAATVFAVSCDDEPEAAARDWESEWALRPGFALEQDTVGYEYPTGVAFVPNPGAAPGDPLYFVTELRGTVKVVTNDRTVHTFAQIPVYDPEPLGFREIPDPEGQGGLASLCLDPATGYVFVTFTRTDEGGIIRNDIMRFETEPGTFAIEPSGSEQIGDFLSVERSGTSHMIGGCQVVDDSLFVAVGDGWQPFTALQTNRLLGKVLRLTLDGEAYPDNPFYDEANPEAPDSYIYSYGHRNPFGLEWTNGSLFAAENGTAIDRFERVDEGRSYLWNGSDASISSAADVVFVPSISPVQTEYYPDGSTLFPEDWRDLFFLAISGGESTRDSAGVLTIDYDFETGHVRGQPQPFVQYLGSGTPGVTALGFGPDGLYFAMLVPNAEGDTPMFKVVPGEHQNLVGTSGNVFNARGCTGCHMIRGQGGAVGPALDFDRTRVSQLEQRLNSDEYAAQVAAVDQLNEEPFVSFREERQAILDAEGEEKVRLWMRNRIMEPAFDSPTAQMPNLGIEQEEADRIVSALLDRGGGGVGQDSFIVRTGTSIREALPFFPRSRGGDFVAGAFVGVIAGAIAGAILLGIIWLFVAWRRRRRHPPSAPAEA